MVLPKDLLREVLKVNAPELRRWGFKGSGKTLIKRVNDVSWVVKYQSSSSSNSDWLKFTVNLGVFSHKIDQLRGGEPIQPIHEPECHWRQRISWYIATGSDHWWVVKTLAEAAIAAAEVCRIFRESVMPQFQQISSTEALAELWRAGKGCGLSAMHVDHLLTMYELSRASVGRSDSTMVHSAQE